VKGPVATAGVWVAILASFFLARHFPQSALAFLLFEGSLLAIYYAPIEQSLKTFLGALVLLGLMPILGFVNGYYLEVAIQIGIYVALALGLNIVVGFVGLLNLGFVAFYAIGAYLWAIFGSPQANAFIAGGLFPLSPNWFFIFLVLSIAVGAVVRALVNNLDKPINLTNGPRGIAPISKPPLFFEPVLQWVGLQVADATLYPLYFYFLVLIMVGLIILVTRRLESSRIGRAWKAIREDEVAASAMGVPVVRMKLLGFAVGASFASAVGVLFAAKQVFINPESFTFMESIGVLAMVILGGMGSIPGAIVGATGVTILNLQLLKSISIWLNNLRQSGAELTIPLLGSYPFSQLPAQFEPAKYERMVFGLILIIMMIFRPQGILPPGYERKK